MIHGVRIFFKALEIMWNDKGIRYASLIPIALFIILLTIGTVAGLFYIDDLLNLFFADQLANVHSVLKGVLYIISFFLFGFLYYVLAFFLTSVMSVPVCALIAEKTMDSYTEVRTDPESALEKIKSSLKMIRVAFVKIVMLVIIGTFLFICSFIPFLAPFVFLSSLILLAFDCTDFAFEKRNFGFRKRIGFLKENFFTYLGLSFGLAVVVLIPLMQFIVLPLTVIGSTLLFSEKYKKRIL